MNTNDLIGKPFEYGGRGPDKYDCWGLCVEISKRAGIFLPDINTPKSTLMRGATFLTTKDRIFEPLKKPEPFCLVAFEIGPKLWHAGVVLENCRHFIHIMRKRMVVIERLDNVQWKRRFKGYYSLAK